MNETHYTKQQHKETAFYFHKLLTNRSYDQVNDLRKNKYGPGTTGNTLFQSLFTNTLTFIIHIQRNALDLTLLPK